MWGNVLKMRRRRRRRRRPQIQMGAARTFVTFWFVGIWEKAVLGGIGILLVLPVVMAPLHGVSFVGLHSRSRQGSKNVGEAERAVKSVDGEGTEFSLAISCLDDDA